MLIYKYDKSNKEYIGCRKADLDPLETLFQKKEVYALPANCTTVAPKKPKEGFTVVFDGKDWVEIEDNRGLTVYDKKGTDFVIAELGPVPEGYTIDKPIILEEIRADLINSINFEVNKAYKKEYEIRGIKGSAENWSDLSNKLSGFGDFTTIILIQGDDYKPVTKEELSEAVKFLYIRSMLIPLRKKQFIGEVNACEDKEKLKEYKFDFEIDKEVEELMKLSTEELNKEFVK